MRATAFLAAWVVALAGLAGACSSGGDDDDPGAVSGGGSVFGDDRPSSDPDVAERIATRAVEATVSECGGSCSADVSTGYARLREGRMLEAFAAFRCADNPEAAFGAGIARVLGVLESEAGDAVLGDLGLAHLPASDVFGANGWLARLASRWNGQAQLTVTGAAALQIDTDQVSADDYELEVSTHDGARRVTFTVETDTALTPGAVISPQYDCTTGNRTLGAVPSVYLSIRQGDDDIDCNVPFSLPAQQCTPSGGSLRVVSSGDSEGAHVEYELSELVLDCARHVYDAASDTEQTTQLGLARVSGLAKADVVLEIDTSDLHEIFHSEDDLLLESVSPSVSTTRLMNHAAAVAGEIASARCYFAKAAEGSGTVFTLPGEMYAGHDIELSAGDARMLAAASGFAAATIELGTSYELDLSLHHAVCSFDDGLDRVAACGTMESFVSEANAKARAAVTRHDRLSAARALLSLALDDFSDGVEQLDENSALVRDPVSMPGWDVARDLVAAARQSLAGNTLVPYVAPGVHVDLQRFFASPPDPAAMTQPLFKLNEECEDLGGGTQDCNRNVELERTYLEAFFEPYSDVDWDGEYEWQTEDELQDAVDQITQQLRDKGLTLER